MVSVHQFQFNPFQENTFVVYDSSGNCVIIDPGCYTHEEEQLLKDFIVEKNLNPKALLNTHAHIDHVLGNNFVHNEFEVELHLHEKDLYTLNAIPSYAQVYGFEAYKESPQPHHSLHHNGELVFGEIKFKTFFTPGHSPGHVVFYNEENNFVINGDVLFNGSFGRVDLPGGDIEILKKSIFDIMFQLPENTTVYCGHGPQTTIGNEIKYNYIHQF